MPRGIALFSLLVVGIVTAAEPVPAPKVLGVIQDFQALPAGAFQTGFLDFWRWPAELRGRARDLSELEIVANPDGKSKLLRVKVKDLEVLKREPVPLLRLAPFYPPEADAIRIRIKVLSGQAVLHVGGPTAYFGNSDVFTEPITIAAQTPPRAVDVDFRLNHPTWRNFRRSGFSTDAPRNYYTRWAQEPVGLYLNAGTVGEFEIERIDLVAFGEGKPFPKFDEKSIEAKKPIADFEDGKLDRGFTLYMANNELEWFEQSWKREKPLRFTPAVLSIAKNDSNGSKCLQTMGPTAEEVHCAGIRTAGDSEANAIAMDIFAEAPGRRDTLLGTGPVVPIDVLVFTAPTDSAFPWQKFEASETLRKHPVRGFDYHLSFGAIRNEMGVPFAIYHTRRYLKPGAWTSLVLPAADFTCVYGAGEFRDRFLRHEPLACGEVIAVAWLSPWCRSGNGAAAVTYRLDDMRFVHVPGSPRELRSFWQLDRVTDFKLSDEQRGPTRIRRMAPVEKP